MIDRENLQRLGKDLKVAVRAGVPLELGDLGGRRQRLTLSRLDAYQKKIETVLPGQNFTAQKIAGVPDRYLVAAEVYSLVGSTAPILEGLSAAALARQQSVRAIAWMWRYLSVVIIAAFFGLLLYSSAIAPEIAQVRADIQKGSFKDIQPVESFLPGFLPWLPWLGMLFGLLLIWGLCGGTKWWTAWLGGDAFTAHRAKKSAVKIVPLLMAVDVPLDEAIRMSCQLAGLPGNANLLKQEFLHTDPFDWRSSAGRLGYQADQIMSRLRFRVPMLLICSVGGILCLLYAILIFYPISAMLQEMGRLHL